MGVRDFCMRPARKCMYQTERSDAYMNKNENFSNGNVKSVYHSQQLSGLEKEILLSIGSHLVKKGLITELENRKYQDLVSRAV